VSFTKLADTADYQRWGEKESKAYIGFFLFTCLAFALFSDGHLGWLWLVVLPLGMIVASLVGGVFSIVSKYLEHRGVLIIPHLIAFAGMGVVIAGTWWLLSKLSY
jgi:hypothetical protein